MNTWLTHVSRNRGVNQVIGKSLSEQKVESSLLLLSLLSPLLLPSYTAVDLGVSVLVIGEYICEPTLGFPSYTGHRPTCSCHNLFASVAEATQLHLSLHLHLWSHSWNKQTGSLRKMDTTTKK